MRIGNSIGGKTDEKIGRLIGARTIALMQEGSSAVSIVRTMWLANMAETGGTTLE